MPDENRSGRNPVEEMDERELQWELLGYLLRTHPVKHDYVSLRLGKFDGCDYQALRRAARALASVGLVRWDEGLLAPSPAARHFHRMTVEARVRRERHERS